MSLNQLPDVEKCQQRWVLWGQSLSTTHGSYIGTLGLMEWQKYVLYVIRKRWSSRFRCTAWKKSNLGKIRGKRVICSLWRHHLLSSDFTCLNRKISRNNYFLWQKTIVADEPRKLMSGIYIEYPKTDLHAGPYQHKRNNPCFSIENTICPTFSPN